MTKAEEYREAYQKQLPQTAIEWLVLARDIDADLTITQHDLGVYMHFSDGSIWLLGKGNEPARRMRS